MIKTAIFHFKKKLTSDTSEGEISVECVQKFQKALAALTIYYNLPLELKSQIVMLSKCEVGKKPPRERSEDYNQLDLIILGNAN